MAKAIRLMGVGWVLVGLLAIGGGISGCGSGSGGTTSDPETTRLVASWRLVKSSGGFTGGGDPVTPLNETLTFKQNGTFTRTVRGESVSGTFTLTRRKTIFSDAASPVIIYSPTALPEVINQLDTERLAISEEAADGYNREYERITL